SREVPGRWRYRLCGSKAGSLPDARRRPPSAMTCVKHPSSYAMVGSKQHGRHDFGMGDTAKCNKRQKWISYFN
ncbi:hypothetical protein HAX54_006783, partial [Datura stramonium]|nr:hypothetical protein [Datura stramonium]